MHDGRGSSGCRSVIGKRHLKNKKEELARFSDDVVCGIVYHNGADSPHNHIVNFALKKKPVILILKHVT